MPHGGGVLEGWKGSVSETQGQTRGDVSVGLTVSYDVIVVTGLRKARLC